MNELKNKAKSGGFIRLIILVVVVLIVLAYLGFDVKKIVFSPIILKIAALIWSLISFVFNLLVKIIRDSWGTIVAVFQYIANFIQTLTKAS